MEFLDLTGFDQSIDATGSGGIEEMSEFRGFRDECDTDVEW